MIEAFCYSCKTKVYAIWSGDFDFEDYGLEGDGLVQVSTCGTCDSTIVNIYPNEPLEYVTINIDLKEMERELNEQEDDV